MNYKTVEVELENGRVRPSGQETLPPRARALLTILVPTEATQSNEVTGLLADQVADLAGIGRGNHADLSTNKAHLDDFGQ